MLPSSGLPLAAKYFLVDILGGILAFPAWWYTIGLSLMGKWAIGSVRSQVRNLGLDVWMKNLFNPMYGATDMAGKLISFALRLVVILARGIAVLAWMFIVLVILVAYLLVLPIGIVGIAFHLLSGRSW